MIGFAVAALMVAYMGIGTVIMWASVEYWWSGAKTLLVIGAWLTIGLGLMFNLIENENSKGPCVQYETQMHYNAATKTMMPARVCTLRGEWGE